MNTLERRVSDALRAYGEGLDMTTQDIDRLEQGLEQKQQVARTARRRRVWEMAVAACAVTGVVLGALALRGEPASPNVPAGPPGLTTTDLAGIWRVDDENGWLWTFTADGMVITSQEPSSPTPSEATGWTVIPAPGGFKTVNETAEWRTGPEACHVTWAATISPEGRMRATVEEASASCTLQPGSDSWEWTRVSPVSVAGASATTLWPTAEPTAVSQLGDLMGTWLLRGTGKLLAITAPGGVDKVGEYSVDEFGDTSEPETGTLTVNGAGEVVLTPRSSPACTAVYESVTSRNSTLEATLASGSCGRLAGATDTWIRLN